MKTKAFYFLLFILFICYALPKGNASETYTPPKRIFLLNSYHQTLGWSMNFEEGLKKYLYNNQYELYIEYLDSRRYLVNDEWENSFLNALNVIYQDAQFDLILIEDDPALLFFNKHYEKLLFAQGVPVIAGGINSKYTLKDNVEKQIEILEEKVYGIETILQIKNFFPERKHLFIISDYSVTPSAIREELESQIANTKELDGYTFTYNDNLSFSKLLNQIKSLPPHTIILISAFHVDGKGDFYANEEVIHSIQQVTDLPIFCLIDTWLFDDVIGGCINGAKYQGEQLGKRAVWKLQEEKKSLQKEPEIETPGVWMFNYPALKKYNLLDIQLPDGSIVINEDPSLKHKNITRVLVTLSIVLLLIIVFVYWTNIVLKKRIAASTQNLKEEIRKFEYFVSEMPIGYVELNAQNEIIYWNKSSEMIFEYTKEEVIGKNIMQLLSTKIVRPGSSDKANGHTFRHFGAMVKTKTGNELFCEWYPTNYLDDPDALRYFIMIMDVTDKRKLQHNLEMMLEKTKEIMLQNDKYASSNIHDIKNLLLPVVAYSEMMLTEGISFDKMKSLAQHLNKNASGLIDYSTEILDINRIRRKLINVEFKLFNIYVKTQDILIVLEANASFKNITIINKLPSEQNVYADEELINSVLLNLVGNAIKFTPQNGEIVIYSIPKDNGYVEINIKDNGIGVDEKMMEEIFVHDRYFTSKGTEGEEGTGLGLVLCKDLLAKNNGSISIKNNSDGKGTTVSFTLQSHEITTRI